MHVIHTLYTHTSTTQQQAIMSLIFIRKNLPKEHATLHAVSLQQLSIFYYSEKISKQNCKTWHSCKLLIVKT